MTLAKSTPALLPGTSDEQGHRAALGVMGGGQLGRMFVHAAQTLGFEVLVLDPDANSPAGAVANRQIRASFSDPAGLAELAERCLAITTEFENVPASSLKVLSASRPVAPGPAAVAVCQDRAAEKACFVACGVPCAPYALIETAAQLTAASAALLPGILKTARLGYDGKGQVRVSTRHELEQAWASLHQQPSVLEKLLPLEREISVIVARSAAGRVVHFPVQQNLHRDGILALTQVPAPDVGLKLQQQAIDGATSLAASLDYVGVLCVEFFVLHDGSLVANEMAPRPHNSGHYSVDACDVSQFDCQVRAMTGLPLVQPRLHSPCAMINLLGDLWFDANGNQRTPAWDRVLALPGVHLHLYGKLEARAGRKMGHLTVTASDAEQAMAGAAQAAGLLGLAGF